MQGVLGLSGLNNDELFDRIVIGVDLWMYCIRPVQIEAGREKAMKSG